MLDVLCLFASGFPLVVSGCLLVVLPVALYQEKRQSDREERERYARRLQRW